MATTRWELSIAGAARPRRGIARAPAALVSVVVTVALVVVLAAASLAPHSPRVSHPTRPRSPITAGDQATTSDHPAIVVGAARRLGPDALDGPALIAAIAWAGWLVAAARTAAGLPSPRVDRRHRWRARLVGAPPSWA